MNNNALLTLQLMALVFGILGGLFLPIVLQSLSQSFSLKVEHDTVYFLLRFGKLVKEFKSPGFHWKLEKIFPWVQIKQVSLQRDFRSYKNIGINDHEGTTMVVDLWVDFSIEDGAKSLFVVENLENSLKNLIIHNAIFIFGTKNFQDILAKPEELGKILAKIISLQTQRWGLKIHNIWLEKISLLPEVSKQLFDKVDAQLEKATAQIQEQGRLKVALLEAETEAKISALVAEAKCAYAKAISQAYESLQKNSEVYKAYKDLFEISQVQPSHTLFFKGFGGPHDGDLTATDAFALHRKT